MWDWREKEKKYVAVRVGHFFCEKRRVKTAYIKAIIFLFLSPAGYGSFGILP